MSPEIGRFKAETCNRLVSPDGATFRLRRQGRPQDLEYYVDVERNGETITLLKDDAHAVARYWDELTAGVEDHSEPERPNPWKFDEYGPKMRRPLPVGEAARQNWKIQLRRWGFSPNTLIDEEYQSHDGFHRDDARKPEVWEQERQRLENLESEETEADVARNDARAVADGGLDPMVERFLKNAERVKNQGHSTK